MTITIKLSVTASFSNQAIKTTAHEFKVKNLKWFSTKENIREMQMTSFDSILDALGACTQYVKRFDIVRRNFQTICTSFQEGVKAEIQSR